MGGSDYCVALPPRFIFQTIVQHHSRKLERLMIYSFLLPAILLLLVFIIPTLDAIRLSFTNEALIGRSLLNPQFVGLENFRMMFSDPNFFNSLRVTVLFLFFSALVVQFFFGLAGAIVLKNRSIKFRALPNAAFIIPMAVPETAAAFMWASMLVPNETGVANLIISIFGAGPINWIRHFPVISIIIINIWRGMGFAFILFSAGLEAIPTPVVEAATIDGASGFKMFRYITVPLLKPTILVFVLLTTVGTIGVFGLVFFLTAGGPARATELIGIYIYKESFELYELGYGAAIGMIMLLLSIVLGILYLKILRVKV